MTNYYSVTGTSGTWGSANVQSVTTNQRDPADAQVEVVISCWERLLKAANGTPVEQFIEQNPGKGCVLQFTRALADLASVSRPLDRREFLRMYDELFEKKAPPYRFKDLPKSRTIQDHLDV